MDADPSSIPIGVLLNDSVPEVGGQDPSGLILSFLVLLLLSAVFAGSETALSTVNRIRMMSYADDGDRRARRVLYILDHFEEALSAILIGNNIMHIGSAAIATLTATGASTYSWNTGENTAEISIAPESNTTYSVTGYDTNGCFATVQKVVNVESLPEVQILGNRTICQGQSTVLTAMGGNTYLWSNGSNTQNIAIFPNVSTTYTVTAYNAFGCSTVESVLITVNVLPSIVFNGSTSICQGESTTITATGGNTYLWSTGANTNNITVSTPGMYKVSVTNSLNGTEPPAGPERSPAASPADRDAYFRKKAELIDLAQKDPGQYKRQLADYCYEKII